MPEPTLRTIRVNGAELAYFERGHPTADRPSLLFVHATGFHGRVWDRIAETFGEYHSIALEQRGHGRSEKIKIEHWRTMGQDMAEFVAALDLSRLIGVGHSMGAHAMVDAAAISGRFARLVLCDPTIPAPESYENPSDFAGFEGDMHPAVKRYNAFKSVDEMIERLLEKGAYHLFDRRVLEDYCRFGLLPDQDGNLRLACPPEIEASVYMSARSNGGVFESVRALEIPVTVLRARVPPADRGLADFASSPTWPGLAGQFKHGREIHYPDVTHFIPMQIPGEVERVIREEIEAWTA